MGYRIEVSQTHSFMSDAKYSNSWRLDDITNVEIPKNSFSQMGESLHNAHCLNLVFKPSGLTIPIFMTGIGTQERTTLEHLHRFLSNDDLNIQIHCNMRAIPGAQQTIIITREALSNENTEKAIL